MCRSPAPPATFAGNAGGRSLDSGSDSSASRSPSAGEVMSSEQRSTPGSQTITYVDVASIAQRFRATYNLTVSRLLGLGLISESDSERLLKRKFVEIANRSWIDMSILEYNVSQK
jgi:hypothetical protein